MIQRIHKANVAACGVAALCTTIGVVLVRERGPMLWWTVLALASTAFLIVMAPQWRRARNRATAVASLRCTATGVEHRAASGPGEQIPWGALAEVAVLTTTATPQEEDVYLVLRDRDGTTLLVPQTEAVDGGLIGALVSRLAGFDHVAYVHALLSRRSGETLVWRAPRVMTATAVTGHAAAPHQPAADGLALAY